MITKRNKVIVTRHARQRIQERIPNRLGYPTDEQLAAAARYNGEVTLKSTYFNSQVARYFRGYTFIYAHNSNGVWKLLTVEKTSDALVTGKKH